MAFAAKDGTKYSNKDSQRTHDRMHSAKSKPYEPTGMEEPGEQPGEEDGAQIAEQHGPAHTIQIQHDHEMGVHEVHSDHPDGHHHASQHGSVEEAHEHAHKLAGKEHSPEAIEGLKKFADEEGEEGAY